MASPLRSVAACLGVGTLITISVPAQSAETVPHKTTVLRLARSSDGLRFTPMSGIFLPDASSPDLERLSEGTLLAVFDLHPDGEKNETVLGSVTSKDEGRSWSKVQRFTITERNGSRVRARHAEVVSLRDDRVRLYFTSDAPKDRRVTDEKASSACVIRSAIARDGGRFRIEPDIGLRFHDVPDAFAATFEFKSRTHLYVSPGIGMRAEQDDKADASIRHAIARDGRRFARVAPIEVKDGVSIDCIVPLGDRLRAYGTSEKGIRSMVSDDGAVWGLESGIRLADALRPAVARLKNGSFLMLYEAPGDRDSADAIPLVDVVEISDEAPATASDGEADAGGHDSLASGDSVDHFEDAEPEIDVLAFAPMPDFQEPVDYMQWYRQELVGPPVEDNAYDAYAAFMTPADGEHWESGTPSDWPELHHMLNDPTYEGVPIAWNPADHADWEKTHQSVQKLLSQYRDASQKSGYMVRDLRKEPPEGPTAEDRLLFSLLLPTLAPQRELSRAAIGDAWRAEGGKVDGDKMIDTFETILRNAEHLSRGSTLIESLVGMAQRQLTDHHARWAVKRGVFNEKQLEKALETLQRFNSGLEDPARFIRGEHAALLDATQYLFGVPGPDGKMQVDPDRAEYINNMVGETSMTKEDFNGLDEDDARAAIDSFSSYFREVIDQMRIGYPDVRSADLEASYEQYAHVSPLTRMAMPAWSRYYHLRGRAEASRRATQLIYATHLYHARTGKWPKSLDDLPADMNRTIRTDPFSGRDFGYRLTPDGPIIYSASENGVDDGGVHSPRWADSQFRREEDSDDFVSWPPQE